MTAIRYFMRIAVTTAILFVLAGCAEKPAAATAPGAASPQVVSVVTVKPEAVAITTELPGRVEATRIAEVRARRGHHSATCISGRE